VGAETPVAEGADGRLRDLSRVTDDLDHRFLESGLRDVERLLPTLPLLDEQPTRWGPPVARPGKVVGIGLNYAAHADESGQPRPSEPVVFLKASTSVCGPGDDIRMLPGSLTTDYEVELGVVVGATLRAEDDRDRALAAVAGYVLADDVSDRSLQLERGGTWTKGKSADTFCPLGPWLVTPDELGDPQALHLRLTVNGEQRQSASTSDMIFTVAELLCYTSSIMTLEPGDVVVTGTPSGVALGQPDPKRYLRHGDLVELDGGVLGTQRNRVVDAAATRHTVSSVTHRRWPDGR
jgi:2-keto-4-pentenoate hydratase/2-oxohepta-3-ene-1,7-dioic acid hydratase in catechol pathway